MAVSSYPITPKAGSVYSQGLSTDWTWEKVWRWLLGVLLLKAGSGSVGTMLVDLVTMPAVSSVVR